MQDNKWDSNEARNQGCDPGVAFAGQEPAHRPHIVIVAVVVDEAELIGEVTRHQNLPRLRHNIRIGRQL